MTKIEALEKYIEELDNKIGFEDDELFLLSIDEYNRYQDIIKNTMTSGWWWLRSPGDYDRFAVIVDYGGSVNKSGKCAFNDYGAVRPALKWTSRFEFYVNGTFVDKVLVGETIIYKNFPFVCIDEKERLFISEVPIGFHRFDKKSNNYATSEIRQYIKNWEKNRK